MLSALKNIQVSDVNINVKIMDLNSLKVGYNEPFATISKLLRFVLKMMDGIMNSAFKKPQTIKVQLAPCQNPLTIKMMNVFLIFLNIPPELPPSGI